MPTIVTITDVDGLNGTWYVDVVDKDTIQLTSVSASQLISAQIPVSSVSATTPVVVTSPAHGLMTGAVVNLSPGLSAAAPVPSKNAAVTVTGPNTFTIDNSSAGAGSSASSGVFSCIPNTDALCVQDEDFEELLSEVEAGGAIDLGTHVVGFNPYSNMTDGQLFEYITRSLSGAYEIGYAYYDAGKNRILPWFIQWSTSGILTAIDPPLSNSTVYGQRPIPSEILMYPSQIGEIEALGQLGNPLGNAGVPGTTNMGLRVRFSLNSTTSDVAMSLQYGGSPNVPVRRLANTVILPGNDLGATLVTWDTTGLANVPLTQRIRIADYVVPYIQDVNDILYVQNGGRVCVFYSQSLTTAEFNIAHARISATSTNRIIGLTTKQILMQTQRSIILDGLASNTAATVVTSFTSATAKALIAAGKIAGIIGAGIQAGMFMSEVQAAALNRYAVRLVQGRLQLGKQVAQADADRRQVGNQIYFVPIYQTDPSVARVTLVMPITLPVVGDTYVSSHFPMLTTTGRCPSISFTNGSNVLPFSLVPGKLPNQQTVQDGIPADVFMCWPASTTEIDVIGSEEPPRPDSISNLPRLFFLNWYSATSRNNGQSLGPNRRGFDLINTDNPALYSGKAMGLCLRSTWAQNDGFVQEQKFAKFNLYMYVGTVVRYAGQMWCVPGMRTIWNQYNRLPYDDFTAPRAFSGYMNRNATMGFVAPFDNTLNSWTHKFVDPTDGSSVLPTISNQIAGVFVNTIVGPQAVEIKHLPSDTRLVYGNNLTPTYSAGDVTCEPVDVSWSKVRVPPNFTASPGLNEIVCYQRLDANIDCRRKRYMFVGNPGGDGSYRYQDNVGIYTAEDNPVDVHLATSQGSLCGFGFSCAGGC